MIGKVSDIAKYLFTLDPIKQYEIKEVKEKRSIKANDYFWTLCNKIAEVLHTSKEEIHLRMLKEYGQVASGMFEEDVNVNDFYDYYDELKPIVKNGKKFRLYKIYQASHKMNVNQLDIPVLTPNEIADMMSRYGSNK